MSEEKDEAPKMVDEALEDVDIECPSKKPGVEEKIEVPRGEDSVKKLRAHIEVRSYEDTKRVHEAVCRMMRAMKDFDERLDASWLPRRLCDIKVMLCRSLSGGPCDMSAMAEDLERLALAAYRESLVRGLEPGTDMWWVAGEGTFLWSGMRVR